MHSYDSKEQIWLRRLKNTWVTQNRLRWRKVTIMTQITKIFTDDSRLFENLSIWPVIVSMDPHVCQLLKIININIYDLDLLKLP